MGKSVCFKHFVLQVHVTIEWHGLFGWIFFKKDHTLPTILFYSDVTRLKMHPSKPQHYLQQ
ncbi:MAG: hypothetical protein AAF206_31505, partial [Bacteroidota bacterium]